MALVHVIRQTVDETNHIIWSTYEIDETELLPGEMSLEQQQQAADAANQPAPEAPPAAQ